MTSLRLVSLIPYYLSFRFDSFWLLNNKHTNSKAVIVVATHNVRNARRQPMFTQKHAARIEQATSEAFARESVDSERVRERRRKREGRRTKERRERDSESWSTNDTYTVLLTTKQYIRRNHMASFCCIAVTIFVRLFHPIPNENEINLSSVEYDTNIEFLCVFFASLFLYGCVSAMAWPPPSSSPLHRNTHFRYFSFSRSIVFVCSVLWL